MNEVKAIYKSRTVVIALMIFLATVLDYFFQIGLEEYLSQKLNEIILSDGEEISGVNWSVLFSSLIFIYMRIKSSGAVVSTESAAQEVRNAAKQKEQGDLLQQTRKTFMQLHPLVQNEVIKEMQALALKRGGGAKG